MINTHSEESNLPPFVTAAGKRNVLLFCPGFTQDPADLKGRMTEGDVEHAMAL